MKRKATILLIAFLLIGMFSIISANPGHGQQTPNLKKELREHFEEERENFRDRIEEQREDFKEIRYEFKENNRLGIKTKLKLKEFFNNKTNESFFETSLSNGSIRRLRIMPNELKKIARERLKTDNISIEIKEVRHKNIPRVIYNIKTNKHGRFLGIFKMQVGIDAEVDPETGEVLRINKPWWAFLISGEDDEEINEPVNETEPQNLTLTINNPENITYNTTEILIDIDSNGDFVSYTINNGNETVYNISLIGTFLEGNNTLVAFANNSEGDDLTESVDFIVDLAEIPTNQTGNETGNSTS